MGHADIVTILNVYTYLRYEDLEREVKELILTLGRVKRVILPVFRGKI